MGGEKSLSTCVNDTVRRQKYANVQQTQFSETNENRYRFSSIFNIKTVIISTEDELHPHISVRKPALRSNGSVEKKICSSAHLLTFLFLGNLGKPARQWRIAHAD